jgi:hypothetical protein
VDWLTLEPKRREAMFSELEYLLRTHGDHEALSHQSSLRDLLTDLRRLADDLGLDFRLALAGAEVADDPFLTRGRLTLSETGPAPGSDEPGAGRPHPLCRAS